MHSFKTNWQVDQILVLDSSYFLVFCFVLHHDFSFQVIITSSTLKYTHTFAGLDFT